LTFV
ncbi:hypothetical protein D018_1951B, partial [Vibrio parahaemolyticus VP2007-007]|jgi:STE24 endopeptidase